jgi:translation elongation factor EF-G
MLNEDYYNTNKNKYEEESLYFWFTEMIYCELSDINNFQKLKNICLLNIELKHLTNNSTIVSCAKEKYREIHFSQLRQTTELYYKIRLYLPTMSNIINKKWNKFVVTIYKKIQELYENIYECYLDELTSPKTNNEKKIVQILLEELRNTEDVLIPFLPKKYTKKHFVKCVIEEPIKVMKSKNHVLFMYNE